MTNQEKWVININDDDVWNNVEEFETKEAAINFVKKDFEGFFLGETGVEYKSDVDDRVFYVGQKERFAPSVDADSILDYIAENAYDEVGETAEGYLNVSTKELNSLEERLNKAFQEWADETNNHPAFWKVVNVEKVII